MSPYEIEMLLHIHYTAEPDPKWNTSLGGTTLSEFIENGLIEQRVDREDNPEGAWQITDRGSAMVHLLCNTKLPKPCWVDEHGGIISRSGP